MAIKTRAEFDAHLNAFLGAVGALLVAVQAQQGAKAEEDFSAEDQQVADATAKVKDMLDHIGTPPVTAGNTAANPSGTTPAAPVVTAVAPQGEQAGRIEVPLPATGVAMVPPPNPVDATPVQPEPTPQPEPTAGGAVVATPAPLEPQPAAVVENPAEVGPAPVAESEAVVSPETTEASTVIPKEDQPTP